MYWFEDRSNFFIGVLSGKDGREIVKHLKRQEEMKYIPVIMFLAHPSAEKTARKAGADDFIAKSFEVNELLAMAERWV